MRQNSPSNNNNNISINFSICIPTSEKLVHKHKKQTYIDTYIVPSSKRAVSQFYQLFSVEREREKKRVMFSFFHSLNVMSGGFIFESIIIQETKIHLHIEKFRSFHIFFKNKYYAKIQKCYIYILKQREQRNCSTNFNLGVWTFQEQLFIYTVVKIKNSAKQNGDRSKIWPITSWYTSFQPSRISEA